MRVSDLESLKNIGPRSAVWLSAVGVETADDLERLGPVEAWRRAKVAVPDEVTIVLLYALQAALLDLHWTELPVDLKRRVAAEATSSRRAPEDRPSTPSTVRQR